MRAERRCAPRRPPQAVPRRDRRGGARAGEGRRAARSTRGAPTRARPRLVDVPARPRAPASLARARPRDARGRTRVGRLALAAAARRRLGRRARAGAAAHAAASSRARAAPSARACRSASRPTTSRSSTATTRRARSAGSACPTRARATRCPGDLVDPLGEVAHEVAPHLVQRYPDRVLLLATDRCAVYCRFCTRSRMVGGGDGAVSLEALAPAFAWLRAHPEVRDVIVSGGDPLAMATDRIVRLVAAVRAIESVETIRLATRVPVTLPMRITPELLARPAAAPPALGDDPLQPPEASSRPSRSPRASASPTPASR